MRLFTRFALASLLALLLILPCLAQKVAGTSSGFVTMADGSRIHYLDAGAAAGSAKGANLAPTLLFVPGWTMPAWIWEHQITHFAKTHRVIAIDPRGQGESSKPNDGYFPAQRGRDIRAVIEKLRLSSVVLVGWSMGVTETAAYVDQFGTDRLAAIVLVDGVAGMDYDPQFTPAFFRFGAAQQMDRAKNTAAFVRGMFRKPPTDAYLQRLTAAALQTPTDSAMALFLGAFTADYRPALKKIDKPTLVVVAGDEKSNPWVDRYRQMAASIPGGRLEMFPESGHALFVDEPARFNSLLSGLLTALPQGTQP